MLILTFRFTMPSTLKEQAHVHHHLCEPQGRFWQNHVGHAVGRANQAAGATVAILDCDPNQNIVQWAAQRTERGRAVPFTVRPVPTEATFLDTVDTLRGTADYLIIDLEGTASQLVTYAISQSDLVLVPFEPTPMEARQAARAVQLVRNTGRMMNRNVGHALLFTKVNAAIQTNDEKDVRKETEANDIPVLRSAIVRRAAYTRIFRDGYLLSELLEQAREDVKGSTASAQERILKPLEAAIQNAREYTQEVVNQLPQQKAAA
uniref:ParA family protein n=1 Tax=Neorhizobium sp. EC2-8 TaxID=3129230 RepID=UPI0031017A7D